MLIRSILALGAIYLGGMTTSPSVAVAPAGVPSFGAVGQDSVEVVTLRVEGMTCGGCTLATRKVLTRLDGVEKAVVTYEPPRAVVTFDPEKVSSEQMIAAIRTLGYRATVVPEASDSVAPGKALQTPTTVPVPVDSSLPPG